MSMFTMRLKDTFKAESRVERQLVRVICPNETLKAQCTVRLRVESSSTVEDVGVYITECDPPIANVDDFSPLRRRG